MLYLNKPNRQVIIALLPVADSGGGQGGRLPPLVAQWLKKRAKVPFKSVENERKCLIGCPFHVKNMIRCPLGCSFIQ